MSFESIINFPGNQEKYNSLKNQIEQNAIVPFVGSGMTAPLYGTWSQFSEELLPYVQDSRLSEEIHILIKFGKYEKAISKVKGVIGEGDFKTLIEEKFSWKDKYAERIRDMAISELPFLFRSTILTTNLDQTLEHCFKERESYTLNEYKEANANSIVMQAIRRNTPYIIKIHGDVNQRLSWILAESEYRNYYSKEGFYYTLIKKLFENKQFLFLGAGLQNDKPIKIIKELGKESHYGNFAFLQIPSSDEVYKKRRKELSNYNINVIWYPKEDTEHKSVKILLEHLHKDIEGVSKKNKLKRKESKGRKSKEIKPDKSKPRGVKEQNGLISKQKRIEVMQSQQSQILNTNVLNRNKTYTYKYFFEQENGLYIKPRVYDFAQKCEIEYFEKQDLKRGDIVLIIGEPGLGKSTILKREFISKKKKNNTIYFWINMNLIHKSSKKENFSKEEKLLYNQIMEGLFPSKYKIHVYIESLDEMFGPDEIENLIEFLNKCKKKGLIVHAGCRVYFYWRYLSDFPFDEKIEICEWKRKQSKQYVKKFLIEKERIKQFWKYHSNDLVINSFLKNPFQATLLLYLFESKDCKKLEVLNLYDLYEQFYQIWIENELKRLENSSITVKEVEEIHYSLIVAFYKNNYRCLKEDKIAFLTPEQKEICNHSVVRDFLKFQEPLTEKKVITGFIHETIVEFLLIYNLLDKLQDGETEGLVQCLSLVYRHCLIPFFELALKLKNKCREYSLEIMCSKLQNIYLSMDLTEGTEQVYFELCQEYLKVFNNNLTTQLMIKDEALYFLGRFPTEYIAHSKLFKEIYLKESDNNIILKIKAATIIISHNLDMDIENDYIAHLCEKNSIWDKHLRAWARIYFGDVVTNNPYVFEDDYGSWTCVREKQIDQLKQNDEESLNVRALCLTCLLIFYRSRDWKDITREDYQVIMHCSVDNGRGVILSKEKRNLVEKIKNYFKEECPKM